MKTRRHSKILELIQQHNIDTQEELLKLLRCLLYTSPSPRDAHESRMPSSA